MSKINRRDLLKGLAATAAAVPLAKAAADLPSDVVIVDESSKLKPIKASRSIIEPIIGESEQVLRLEESLDYELSESKSHQMMNPCSAASDLKPIRFLEMGRFLRVSVYSPDGGSALHDAILNYEDVRVIHTVNNFVLMDEKLRVHSVSLSVDGPSSEIIMDLSGRLSG